jgi:hypothetical protein
VPADFIIRTGDFIRIMIPPPTIIPSVVAPVPLMGTGMTLMVVGRPTCLLGDELPPMLRAPQPYTSPPFVTPGMGLFTVILTPTNQTQQTLNGRPILIRGTPFIVQFQVSVPAMQPTPAGPIPDPMLLKPGTGQFITTNPTVMAG